MRKKFETGTVDESNEDHRTSNIQYYTQSDISTTVIFNTISQLKKKKKKLSPNIK